ncbi:MAG: aminoacyl-tRNA hydrolase [Planctomycetales bacterium]|nr:aminoacyl-tRNA hydrolase [Planctomycetales bacterium]
MLTINNQLQVPLREFTFTFARSSGPGGQNVNKLNTKATLRWTVRHNESLPTGVRDRFLARYRNRITEEGELVLTSQRFRDQGRNVADCLNKLRDMIAAVATPPKQRKATRPSKGSKMRRLKNKQEQSEKKQRRRSPRVDD